ncbi:MAG: right-handed parallel beta-helix repeat-containing protein [Bacteroidetes bacterium]|nr:right-handed parallel beta-helix repeat-containing protein [Bacteroidota bacterium]
MKESVIKSATAIIICLIIFVGKATASIHITSDTTWSGTVNISTEIYIDNGVTLTILPGSQVIFAGHTGIQIQGRLLAVGTRTDSIRFYPTNTSTGWDGILFGSTPSSNDSSKICYCVLSYSKANTTNNHGEWGGTIAVFNFNKLLLANSNMHHNEADNLGGALYCKYSSPAIRNTIFANNYSGIDGGAIGIEFCNPLITDILFIYNSTVDNGAGIYLNEANSHVTNCTFSENNAGYMGGAVDIDQQSAPVFTNCIFYHDICSYGSEISISAYANYPDFYYCLVEGGLAGIGGMGGSGKVGDYQNNLDTDPLFAGSGSHPFSLQPSSPCINTGKPNMTGLDVPVEDIAGNPRIRHLCYDIIDRGAYENLENSKISFSGAISVNTYWCADTINITGNVTINNGVTLYIGKGVVVYFQGASQLTVNGCIVAEGDSLNYISFTTIYQWPTWGWGGMIFNNVAPTNDTSRLTYCKFLYGGATDRGGGYNGGAIYVNNSGKLAISNCIFLHNWAASEGGALYLGSTNLNIRNCTFSNNQGVIGGAISGHNSTLTLSGDKFTNNSASNGDCNGSIASHGGAIYLNTSTATVTGSLIANNQAGCKGGGIYARSSALTMTNDTIRDNTADDCTNSGGGGGLTCYSSTLTATGNVFSHNNSSWGGGVFLSSVTGQMSYNTIINNFTNISGCIISQGGGIAFESNANPVFKYNTVTNNSSAYGAGIIITSSNPQIINNLIINNNASTYGGAFYLSSASPLLLNNTISSNIAYVSPAIYCNYSGNPEVRNSIIYNNTHSGSASYQIFLYDHSSNPDFYYCNVQNGINNIAGYNLNYTGHFENNTSFDPMFVTTGTYPYQIQPGSSCLNTGDPATTTTTVGPYDLAGNPRIENGRIDIGAYETTQGEYVYAGSAIHFTQENDSVILDNAGHFLFGNTFTIEFWLKADSMSTDYHTIIKKGNEWEVQLFYDNAISIIEFGINSNSVFGYYQTTGPALVNKWNHIAAVFDLTPGNEYVTIYVNGQQGESDVAESLNHNTLPVTIGSGILGLMDELRIWQTARTLQQIREDMHLMISPGETGLVAYHQFNENFGTTVIDLAGGNNGTLMNMSVPACFVKSTVPAAGGVSNQQIVSNTGNVVFPATDLTMNVSLLSSTDTVVVSRLDTLPNCDPPDANKVFGKYWIVEPYGGGAIDANLTFKVPQVITSQDLVHLNLNRLYQRGSNSDSSWTFNENASSANISNNTVTFNNINQFGQFCVPHTLIPQPYAGDALFFNGVNQYVQVDPLYDTAPGALTVEAWVYPTDLDYNEFIYHGDNGEFQMGFNNTNMWFGVKLSNHNWYSASAPSPELNTWQHVCGVWVSGGLLKLYVNGNLIQSVPTPPALQLFDPGSGYLPSFGALNRQGNFFHGKLDEIRIWNVARTTQQIRENMHLTLADGVSGLIGYWQFNDGSGNFTEDHGSNHDGTLKNMTNSNWVPSSIPAGGGTSNTKIIASTGIVDFTGTGIQMNFTQKTGTDTIVATRIDTTANILPEVDTTYASEYWVIHKYGNGSLNAGIQFAIDGDVTAYDANHPHKIALLKRPCTSENNWIFSNLADSANSVNNKISFNGITTFSQFAVGKGIYADINLNPDSIIFSRTPSTLAITDSVLIYNKGTDTLKISGISHSNSQFTLSATQMAILSGEQRYLKVTYHPASDGLVHDTLHIASNDPDEPVAKVTIRAEGFVIDSWPGTALLYNGSSKYVEVADNNTLDLTNNYTLEAWIYPESFTFLGGIISKYQTSGANGYYLRLTISSPYTGLNFDGLSTAQGVLEINKWYHIAAVNNNGTRILYVNGVSLPLSGTADVISSNSDPFTIGVDYLAGARYFNGKIDEVRLWDSVRTQRQIRENMHLTLKGNEPGLVSYWQFNEGAGTGTVDKIHGNNGILHYFTGPDWIGSTISAGGGTSFTNAVISTGQVTFPGTGMNMNFLQKSGSDTIVVSRIDSSANINPSGLNQTFDKQYWVVHKYGNGTFNSNLAFTLKEDLSSRDERDPSGINLYTRGNTADTNWAFRTSAISVDTVTNQATFDGITGFSQFITGRCNVIYVRSNATGSNNGKSWSNAYTVLQTALDSAVAGNHIWVAAGTYKPSSTYNIPDATSRDRHFRMKNNQGIFGGFAGTEPDTFDLADRDLVTNQTILSGDLNNNGVDDADCYHVFYHPSGWGLNSSALLDGFTIRGGNADGDYLKNQHQGGGISNYRNSPTIHNCIITHNAADEGGGVAAEDTCTSVFINCVIINNTAIYGGGGISTDSSANPTLINCVIANNSARGGGGVSNGMVCNPIFNNCIIWGNIATTGGNAGKQIYIFDGIVTLNFSCYSNGTNDIDSSEGGSLYAINNNITTDPLFVNAATGDFRIYGNSPCVNSGHNGYNSLLTDVRGQARIQNTTIDRGAYEWTAGIDPPALVFIWTGSVSNDWNTAGNWNTNSVPGASDDVLIPDVANDPFINNAPVTPAVCKSITIGTGAVLTIETGKALMVNGTLIVN